MKLEDKILFYENQYKQKLSTQYPIIVRLDGNNFSSFTKVLKKPYDERLGKLMIETAKFAQQETNANFSYVQSDEITLWWYNEFGYNGNKIYKVLSKLAAKVSVYFNKELSKYIPEKHDARKNPNLIVKRREFVNVKDIYRNILKYYFFFNGFIHDLK